MKPRTTVIVAAALFAVAAAVAIIVVSTGGSGTSRYRHHHPIDDVADPDEPIPLITLDQARRAAVARPTVRIEIHDDRYVVSSVEVAAPVYEVIQRDDPTTDANEKLRETLEKVHVDAGDDADVEIEADPAVLHGVVVGAMDAAKSAGFVRLSFKTL